MANILALNEEIESQEISNLSGRNDVVNGLNP
jgi:hypothetical protein